MVSVSKNGHFQKHSTTEMGVAIIPCTLEKVTVDLCPVSGSQKTYYGLFVKYIGFGQSEVVTPGS